MYERLRASAHHLRVPFVSLFRDNLMDLSTTQSTPLRLNDFLLNARFELGLIGFLVESRHLTKSAFGPL
jgi:hypothetical protein